MKFLLALTLCYSAEAFIIPGPSCQILLVQHAIAGDIDAAAEQRLDDIASKLKLQVYDVDSGVYGIESKDPAYGIENIRANALMDEEDSLGLELTQVAHSDLDHRGLVLVSKVSSKQLHDTPIHVGDTIIGVYAGEDFQESVTGLDYDETFDTIVRAKHHAKERGLANIELELNRVVKRETVHVLVEDDYGKVISLEGLAGDNLRLLLMHHNAPLYGQAYSTSRSTFSVW